MFFDRPPPGYLLSGHTAELLFVPRTQDATVGLVYRAISELDEKEMDVVWACHCTGHPEARGNSVITQICEPHEWTQEKLKLDELKTTTITLFEKYEANDYVSSASIADCFCPVAQLDFSALLPTQLQLANAQAEAFAKHGPPNTRAGAAAIARAEAAAGAANAHANPVATSSALSTRPAF